MSLAASLTRAIADVEALLNQNHRQLGVTQLLPEYDEDAAARSLEAMRSAVSGLVAVEVSLREAIEPVFGARLQASTRGGS
jgi:hypothetical protein